MPTARHHHDVQSVTSAPEARTEDQARRLKQYLITMGIRTACFILLVVVDETPQITRGPDEPHESDGSATDR